MCGFAEEVPHWGIFVLKAVLEETLDILFITQCCLNYLS